MLNSIVNRLRCYFYRDYLSSFVKFKKKSQIRLRFNLTQFQFEKNLPTLYSESTVGKFQGEIFVTFFPRFFTMHEFDKFEH